MSHHRDDYGSPYLRARLRPAAASVSDREAAIRMAEEIRDERGPNRVMEIQRARMWDREPHEWTRYERHLSEALLETEAELAAAHERLDDLVVEYAQREERLREALRPFTNYDLHAVHWRDKHYRLVPHTVIAEWIAHIENARDVLADGEGEKDDAVYGDWRDNPGNYGE